jgi:hypothetical protein
MGKLSFFQLLVGLCIACAEVTILSTPQVLYDRSPKLRIKCLGLEGIDDHDIKLDISATGTESLRVDKDFSIGKDENSEGLILKLHGSRKWVDLEERSPPVALILRGVYFASSPQTNLLADAKDGGRIVAQVLRTPTVEESYEVKYQTKSAALSLNGTGFAGAKKIDLYFSPPLLKGIAYELATRLPTHQRYIQLRLRGGFKWRETPGKLKLIGIDTGAGPVKVNGDDGLVVAIVKEDLESHQVTAVDTSDAQKIYHDEPKITISGSGFNPDGTYLRFSNGIMGAGVNYTTSRITETEITLKLVAGSYWRKNVDNLPGFLTLLAVNNGDGWVGVGPVNSGKGKDVASVFERPSVFSSDVEIYRTHSHEFHVKGRGFTRVMNPTQLTFAPPLSEGIDYSVRVVDRTDLEVTLKDTRAWRESPGPLIITAISTRGDGGWIQLSDGQGVHVADVVKDVSIAKTGGVEVFPMGTRIYQSALQERITVVGSGFKNDVRLNLDPPLKLNVDYTQEVLSPNKMVLSLVGGRKWAKAPSFLIVKSVSIGGDSFDLAGSDGIRIAVVMGDPVVTSSSDKLHETQSKVISIRGSGFTNTGDTKIQIRPSLPGSYKVLNVLDGVLRVQLMPEAAWLPGYLSLKEDNDEKNVPLQVTSIDTGAGEVNFEFPITIGKIYKDREGVVCDDSCEYAFDGVCDDGTETDYYEYYEEYGYYQDDDAGGYYDPGDDDDDGEDDDEGEDDDDADSTKGKGKGKGQRAPARKAPPTKSKSKGKLPVTPVLSKGKGGKFTKKNDDDDEADDDETDDDETDDDEYEDDDDEAGHREGYYAESYDDYYAADDAYTVSACLEGTDCTDCGGVDAIVDYSKAPAADSKVPTCANSCPYARDGICDDPRGNNYCALGTDCADCGPVGAGNFTKADDDGWFDDDDDEWEFDDEEFTSQTHGLKANRHKVAMPQLDTAGPAAMFLIVLEGLVYAVGGIFICVALYTGLRVYNGESIPFLSAFDSTDASFADLDKRPSRKMAITPDVIRT